ncbi:TorD/DmsD family molecular chaperone [Sulfurospirillum oryzae]|uniref:TorD/DmsD family molecular chaperone n=1 Tax=Sulfurospirillum oryzae TaxID=2976535 RepID=UPI0021E78C7E|nr:molecular chaperone TorD family protein [Sulfurospirillum oryzae]
MNAKNRAQMYAFLSKMFATVLDEKLIGELKNDRAILELVLDDEVEWFVTTPLSELEEALNVDFSSLFLMHSLPIESSILDDKEEVLVGLQNPVMQFYFEHGYELNLTKSELQAPDHLSLECAFMQNLILKNEVEAQRAFLQKHLLNWAPMYLLGIANMAQTPFYRELCALGAEYIIADYEGLC